MNTTLSGQDVQQTTDGESQYFDSNYEQIFTVNGIGYYSSYIDDRIFVFELDTKSLVYKSGFDMCEQEMVEWMISGKEVIYVGYERIIIENIFDSNSSEEYDYQSVNENDIIRSLNAYVLNRILHINIFPGPTRFQFDVDRRNILDISITNSVFTTENYFYHTTGFFENTHFIRTNRTTNFSDTLLSDYTIASGSYVDSKDRYYHFTEDNPILVVDRDDSIKNYDFEYGRISSGVETSSGRLIFGEVLANGTVLYEIDLASANLVRKDTIFSDKKINILDSNQDRLYVEFNSQFDDSYGYMDYPYLQVEVFTEGLQYFSSEYSSESQDLFMILHNENNYYRDIILVEKASNEINNLQFKTSFLSFDAELEIVDTDNGVRFIVSEEEGKVVYNYDAATNSVSKLTSIDNERGLGTQVQRNGEGFLVVNEHSLHTGFEYIHPETKEINYHEVEGIIHGSVIPYEGNFFYIRNQNFQVIDEDFYLDYVMFDPINGEITIIEEQFFYPKILSSFPNINNTEEKFGFQFVYNLPLVFDLRNQNSLNADLLMKSLLENIYFESENFFFSSSGSPEFKHYKIDKSDYQNRELLFTGEHKYINEVDENSFIAILQDEVYFVLEDETKSIDPPSTNNDIYGEVIDNELYLTVYDDGISRIKIHNLVTEEERVIEADGYVAFFADEFIVTSQTIYPPYDLTTVHLDSGDTYSKTFDLFFRNIFTTDTSIYMFFEETSEVKVFNLQWEEIEFIETSILDNASFRIISSPGEMPIIFQVNKPQMGDQFKNIADFSLIFFDPMTNSLVEYFDCESDLRFNKAFNFEPSSQLLLRSEDSGYQVYDVKFPEFNSTSTEDAKDFIETIRISPNPTNGIASIDKEYESATLFNSIGQQLDVLNNVQIVNLGTYADGIYFLRLKLKNGSEQTVKIIKQ